MSMLLTKYRGFVIAQQKSFGPLKLLMWVEGGSFIVIKNDTDAMPGATFQNPDDAKKAIDLHLEYNDNLRKFFGS